MFPYISLRLIQIFKFLVTRQFLLWFFDDSPCKGILLILYLISFFHLSRPHIDRIANLLDACLIHTFPMSLCVAVRLEVTVQVSPLH